MKRCRSKGFSKRRSFARNFINEMYKFWQEINRPNWQSFPFWFMQNFPEMHEDFHLLKRI